MIEVSASDLFTRYPEFSDVDSSLADIFISEAMILVDETWDDRDQKPAILALAAHYLFLEGYPKRLNNENSFDPANSGRTIQSRKVGDVELRFDAASGSNSTGSRSTLQSSIYGKKFYELQRRNVILIGNV